MCPMNVSLMCIVYRLNNGQCLPIYNLRFHLYHLYHSSRKVSKQGGYKIRVPASFKGKLVLVYSEACLVQVRVWPTTRSCATPVSRTTSSRRWRWQRSTTEARWWRPRLEMSWSWWRGDRISLVIKTIFNSDPQIRLSMEREWPYGLIDLTRTCDRMMRKIFYAIWFDAYLY